MTKFHINKNGEAALCTATVKACPLDGFHGDAEEVAREIMRRDMLPNLTGTTTDVMTWAGASGSHLSIDHTVSDSPWLDRENYADLTDDEHAALVGAQIEAAKAAIDEHLPYGVSRSGDTFVRDIAVDLPDDWNPSHLLDEHWNPEEVDRRFYEARNEAVS